MAPAITVKHSYVAFVHSKITCGQLKCPQSGKNDAVSPQQSIWLLKMDVVEKYSPQFCCSQFHLPVVQK